MNDDWGKTNKELSEIRKELVNLIQWKDGDTEENSTKMKLRVNWKIQ